jgi:phosphocarrier protein HPr
MVISREVVINNKLGMHARAAAKFVQVASRFGSDIEVGRDGKMVNGKSIMGVMMLAAAKGTQIVITAEGDDADEAVSSLEQLVLDRFGEDE